MDKIISLLEQADKETRLAVDIIYLLETNEIDIKLALKALKIVESDLQNKLAKQGDSAK